MTWHDMMYLMYFRETGAHQDGWQKIVSWLTDSVTDITKTWDAIASKKWNRYCCLAVLCLCQWKIQLTHKLHIFNFTIGNVLLVLPLFSISQKYQKAQNGTSFAQKFMGKIVQGVSNKIPPNKPFPTFLTQPKPGRVSEVKAVTIQVSVNITRIVHTMTNCSCYELFMNNFGSMVNCS